MTILKLNTPNDLGWAGIKGMQDDVLYVDVLDTSEALRLFQPIVNFDRLSIALYALPGYAQAGFDTSGLLSSKYVATVHRVPLLLLAAMEDDFTAEERASFVRRMNEVTSYIHEFNSPRTAKFLDAHIDALVKGKPMPKVPFTLHNRAVDAIFGLFNTVRRFRDEANKGLEGYRTLTHEEALREAGHVVTDVDPFPPAA